MGAWAIASFIVASIIWTEGEANPQLFQDQLPYQSYNPILDEAGRRLYGTQGEVEAQPYSASGLHPHNRLSLMPIEIFPKRNPRFDQVGPLEGAFSEYSNFEDIFERNLDDDQGPQTFSSQETADQYSEDQATDGDDEHHDHITAQTVVYAAPPENVKGGRGERFQRTLPDYDHSEHHHLSHDKHGEVHFHKHEHVHEHKHKQEHHHKHNQKHKHAHMHDQKHKHEHHSEHKHGHHQEHKHHQDHTHEHHNTHDHKHSHHGEHKHGHKHEHGHKHHNMHKHHHKHGHKHMNKHGHTHKHHHSKHH